MRSPVPCLLLALVSQSQSEPEADPALLVTAGHHGYHAPRQLTAIVSTPVIKQTHNTVWHSINTCLTA